MPGGPDGIWTGGIRVAHDASGGNAAANLLLGASQAEVPLDVIMSIDNWWIRNLHTSAITSGRLLSDAGDLLLGQRSAFTTDLFNTASLAAEASVEKVNSQPIWLWFQKGDSFTLMTLNFDNLDTADHQLVAQGRYWYVGPRRLAQMQAEG